MPRFSDPIEPAPRDPANDDDWTDLAGEWCLRSDTIYLNHGSFSPALNAVRYARRDWCKRLDEQPMDFFLRQFEPAMDHARDRTAAFVGTSRENLVLVDNATYGMNAVAESFPLSENDEVLINDHEYGAVLQIWERRCKRVGAKLVCASLPERIESKDQVLQSLISHVTDKTKLAVFSHITSPTALILPVSLMCAAFSERGIATCVDGPHAPAQVELAIDELNCDYYLASCHKWMCATLGTGFLYVHPRRQDSMEPPIKSWGRLLPATPQKWDEEFAWLGTRDPSHFLSIPTAIQFMERVGLENFRSRSRWLASYAENCLRELFGTDPIASREQGWYGSMVHVPMPAGDWSSLQKQLWEQIGIEVMMIDFNDQWFIRVSCHLYNNTTQIDMLIKALSRLTH